MTIRTFWTIFIKILGIWLVLSCVTVIPQFLSAFPFFGASREDDVLMLYSVLGLFLLTIGIYAFVLYLFVFRTSWLIDKLHLDKGFTEEKIDLKITPSTVLTIATIVIGGFIFVNAFPNLCKQIFVFFQQKTVFRESPSSGWIIFYLAETFLGYFLITNSNEIVAFIEKKSSKGEDQSE